jgi:hypothetical protein
MSDQDPYNLQRFLAGQAEDYECALCELERGQKESHWIWFIFPQVAGLGRSPTAQEYAIQSKGEAIAYLKSSLNLGRLIGQVELPMQTGSLKLWRSQVACWAFFVLFLVLGAGLLYRTSEARPVVRGWDLRIRRALLCSIGVAGQEKTA